MKNMKQMNEEYMAVLGTIVAMIALGFIVPQVAWLAWIGAGFGFIALFAVMISFAIQAKNE